MPLKGETIGFIGLGLMGRPMSRHLLEAGAELVVYNRSSRPVEQAVDLGMQAAESPRDVARRSTVTILMVCDTPAVESVLFGSAGLAEGLSEGALVIDMGTTAVAATRDFAARLDPLGVDYVDAPVSGGQIGAENASLTIMAGGSEQAFTRALPLLEVLGQRVTRVGEVGAGQVAKAANQVIVGLSIGAVAEALALARRAGADVEAVREALLGGFAGSQVLQVHGRRMIDGCFEPGGKVVTQHKDLSQALELARELGLELPATALNRHLYERLIAMGHGDLDHSALIKVLDA